MKIIYFPSLSFILMLVFSCNSKEGKNLNESIDSESIKEKTNIVTNSEINLDSFIDNYVRSLNNSEIKFLNSKSCNKNRERLEYSESEARTYEFNSITEYKDAKTFGDLNDDGKQDCIVNYDCDNCWNGIGAGNYLSNCFFIISTNGNLEVDEFLTLDFKQKLTNKISEQFGNPYVKINKQELINGISFEKIENQIIYGEFNVNTENCDGSPFPCFKGKFEYSPKRKSIKVHQIQ